MSAPLPPVLVVDDEKNMRRSLQTMLGDEGYDVRAVESAEEALSLVAREKFFMVITDASFGWLFSNIYLWGNSLVRRIKELSVKKTEQKRKRKVREEYIEREKTKPKRQVTIVEPKLEPPKKLEQEAFSFMNVAGEFNLPPMDLLNKPPTDKRIAGQ